MLLLLALGRLLWLMYLMVVGVGEGEHRISRSTRHHHVMLGHWRHRVVLQWHGSVYRHSSNARYWSTNGSWEVRKLSVLVLVWLVSCVDHVLGCWLWFHAEGLLLDLRGVDRGVVGAKLMIGHRWAGIHRVVGRRRELLMFQVVHFGDADEIGATIVHESSVW